MMQNSNAQTIGQASQVNLLVNVYTSVHVYGKQSISPHIGQVLVSNASSFPLHSLGGGVVGHNSQSVTIL